MSKEQMHSENYNAGRSSGNFDKEEGPRHFQFGPSVYSGIEARQFQHGPSVSSLVDAASEASEWTYPCRRESAMQPPRHYERRSKLPGQNRGGGPSFSSTSNQAPAGHTGFGGGPSFSSISNQAPAEHTDFCGGPLFSYTSNQAPAQHTGFGGGPSFSSTSNQVPAQHTGFGGGPSFSYASNQAPAQHTGFGGGPSFSYTSKQVPRFLIQASRSLDMMLDLGAWTHYLLLHIGFLVTIRHMGLDIRLGFSTVLTLSMGLNLPFLVFNPSMSEFAPGPPNPPFQ